LVVSEVGSRFATFAIASDGVDPSAVPRRQLRTGAAIPAIGLGTFGSDRFSADQIADAVLGAAAVGYRHFDCAAVYGNEPQIGRSLRTIMDGGVRREDLWITSKLWNDRHGEGQVALACERSLADLGLDYLDLYLVHWPFPNHHPPGCDVAARNPHARPYVHAEFMKTWRQMEALVERGLVRHIGTSNMTIPKMELLLRDARIPPHCNEMELHPHFQQPELFRYVIDRGIVPIGYCPIGSPNRPERDRTATDTAAIEDPVIMAIAERRRVHPAIICLKWAIRRGQVPIPFSVRREQYLANLKATASEPLTDDELKQIAEIDRNNRLIKGQVFLWKDGQSWEDLWDPSGEITPH
jgi:diketogulonate reductase-like aldo/keto reductase